MLFSDIAPKNRHASDSDAQCEEGLSHCGVDGLENSVFTESAEIRGEVEVKRLLGPRHGQCLSRKEQKHEEQKDHHHFNDGFHSSLQPETAGQTPQQHRHSQIQHGPQRRPRKGTESLFKFLGRGMLHQSP